MECHDAKLLLMFAQRKCENLDDVERAALEQHLGACPDCDAFAQAEHRVDSAFSKVMLDVPVPSDLSQRITKRLADQRPMKPWKWLAAAAAILLAISGIGVWYSTQPRDVTVGQLVEFVPEPFMGMPPAEVEKHFADAGVSFKAPIDFDFDYLQHAEVVEFQGRRVGKLYFRRQLGNGVLAQAYVLVLPHNQFRVDQLPAGQLNHATTIEIKHLDDFTFAIYHRGNLMALLKPNIAASRMLRTHRSNGFA